MAQAQQPQQGGGFSIGTLLNRLLFFGSIYFMLFGSPFKNAPTVDPQTGQPLPAHRNLLMPNSRMV